MRTNRNNDLLLNQYKDKITLLLLMIIIFLGTFNMCSRNKEYVLTDGKKIEAPELEKFCNAFIDQMINKALHKEMVEPDIFEVLIEGNYKVLNLVGHEKSLYSRSSDQDCSVIVQDRLGLRRFDLKVNKSHDYPFFYRVQKIDEPRIEG